MKEKKKGYGQVLGCDLLLELVKLRLNQKLNEYSLNWMSSLIGHHLN
jgi:hypothetical protein